MRYLTCQHLLAWSPCQAQISWRLRHLSSHPENQKIELIRECKTRCRLGRLIVSFTTWTPIIELGHKKRKTGLKPLYFPRSSPLGDVARRTIATSQNPRRSNFINYQNLLLLLRLSITQRNCSGDLSNTTTLYHSKCISFWSWLLWLSRKVLLWSITIGWDKELLHMTKNSLPWHLASFLPLPSKQLPCAVVWMEPLCKPVERKKINLKN